MDLFTDPSPNFSPKRTAHLRPAKAKPYLPRPPWAPSQRLAGGAQRPVEGGGDGGLPKALKSGMEAVSGIAMDDVRVHRNSAEPAKLGALAFARGADIHLGPGEERYLPHEAWHVVQQKQGRVSGAKDGHAPFHEASLEAEADLVASRLAQLPPTPNGLESARRESPVISPVVQLKKGGDKKGSKEEKLEDYVKVKFEPLDWQQTIPSGQFDIVASLKGSVAFEQKQVSGAVKALTTAEWKAAQTTFGTKIDLTVRDFKRLVSSLLKSDATRPAPNSNVGFFVKTQVGAVSIETAVNVAPPGVETTVTPKEDIVFDLGMGLRAVVTAEFKIKAVVKPGLKPLNLPQSTKDRPSWDGMWAVAGVAAGALLSLAARIGTAELQFLDLLLPSPALWDNRYRYDQPVML